MQIGNFLKFCNLVICISLSAHLLDFDPSIRIFSALTFFLNLVYFLFFADPQVALWSGCCLKGRIVLFSQWLWSSMTIEHSVEAIYSCILSFCSSGIVCLLKASETVFHWCLYYFEGLLKYSFLNNE